jgi:hypothetical protein
MKAAMRGLDPSVSLLVSKGANINAKSNVMPSMHTD